MKYLFIALLFLSSCKDTNETKKETKKEDIKINKRKDVQIKNETFHLKVDGRNLPEQKVNVLGQYTTDRFEEAKKSVFLDGVSDVIEIDNHENLNPKNALSISIWYKPDSYKGIGNNSILWKGFSEYKAPYAQYLFSAIGNLYPTKPGTFKFGLSIDGKLNQLQTKPNTWEPNKWYNLTGTYDGEKIMFYVNGKLVNQRAVKGKLDIYDSNLLIGKTAHKDFYTSGAFDDFRIFDRALTTQEVDLLFLEQ